MTATYALGAEDHEIARLDLQAAWLDAATRTLLQAAGVGPGMRVLDLGTGLGHVAMAAADLVGESGRVVGIDTSTRLLHRAAERASGCPQLRFVEGDVRSWRAEEPFDVVVGRLVLFHLPDAADVLRHHRAALRSGGLMVALDFDLGSMRAEPAEPLVAQATDWVLAAFRSAGADPMVGARLGPLLTDAGFADVQTSGIQDYLAPEDPRGPAMLSGVVRSLVPRILAEGIATSEQIGLDTLTERLASRIRASRSVLVSPILVGAWGRRP